MILQREKEIIRAFFKNRGSNREARSIRLKWSRNMDVAADRLVKQHDAVRIVRHFQSELIGRTAYVLKIDGKYKSDRSSFPTNPNSSTNCSKLFFTL